MIRVSAPTLRADARARGVLVHRIQTPAVLLAVRVAAVAAFLPPVAPPVAPPPSPPPSPAPGTFISLRSVSAASATSFLCSLRLSASSSVHVIWLPSLASTSLELSCHAASWSMISLSCPGRRSRPTGQLCTSNALLLWSSLPRSNPGAMHSLMSMSSSSRTLDISSADMSSSYGSETDASAI